MLNGWLPPVGEIAPAFIAVPSVALWYALTDLLLSLGMMAAAG
jgi:hypothetical protein